MIRRFHSTTAHGNLSFMWDKTRTVVTRRRQFLAKHQLTLQQCVTVHTQNGQTIREVTAADAGCGMTKLATALPADALVTRQPSLGLFLLTADCIPLTLYDPVHQVLALIHVSRQTTTQQLTTHVIEYLRHWQCQPADLHAEFGPSIAADSYVITPPPELLTPAWEPFLTPEPSLPGSVHVDLISATLAQLLASGLQTAHIVLSPVDTFRSPTFFSHRRSQTTGEAEGRFATVALLE